MHQFVNNCLPSSFGLLDTWTTNTARREEIDGPVLRNALDFLVPFSRLTSTNNHPLISFPRTRNEFDSLEIKLNPSKPQSHY
jgi:hypothetical protein